jgi:hypothetical protein
MDRLEASLQAKSESVFISYDELDTLFFSDWEAMGRIIRGLVAFWGGYSRRWRRIRAKIFLRTDFYQHHGDVAGADIAKLAASRVELSWSDRYLYAMLIKHVANISEDLFDYCRKAGIEFEPRDEVLGWLPKIIKAEDARPFVERMVGPYMGLTNKKGHSFTWILDHIRDGNGNASPRSLVLLFEFASELERGSPRATGVQLLSPVSLRNALDKVSRWYVEQAKTSEFRWLDGVARRLQADREVPWQRRDLERLLRTDWDKSWHPTEDVRPPAESARELVDALVEFGIVRARGNELFDVPDLFLAGLDLVRRGGVRRN